MRKTLFFGASFYFRTTPANGFKEQQQNVVDAVDLGRVTQSRV